MNRRRGEQLKIKDLSWVWLESRNGRVRAQVKLMEGVQEDTVWTWNAVGKQSGAWGLSKDANEATDGFLLNHLISELLPAAAGDGRALSNSDPVTGQAAWYDLKVKICPASPHERGSWPRFEPASNGRAAAGNGAAAAGKPTLRYQTHAAVNLRRTMRDVLTRGRK